MTGLPFPPSRSSAVEQLTKFLPAAGRPYDVGRNTDAGPGRPSAVSRLSPYVRYRLITEHDVVSHVLGAHSLKAAEKFVQEVLWRTYWKGWLEMRPSVWSRFLQERDYQRDTFPAMHDVMKAEAGQTGIEGFDDWARELVEAGYLHNHARMWFASIWIFTLRLPWSLGADFFLRHLLDADPASNTLSWRWVAGLQTCGKTYLATTDNIARYTQGRFAPRGLAQEPFELTEAPLEPARHLKELTHYDASQSSILLVTHEDMHPESIFDQSGFRSVLVAADPDLLWGDGARAFARSAALDATLRAGEHFGCAANLIERLNAPALIAAADAAGVKQIVTPYAPVGPVADALAHLAPLLAREGIRFVQVRRAWDSSFWPHAKKGFFPFKEQIPAVLREAGFAT